MIIQLFSDLKGKNHTAWTELLYKSELTPDENISQTVLIFESGKLIATGSRQENILKCIAVDSDFSGENLTATVITTLRKEAFKEGFNHLFLYTKPKNENIFSSLFFYPIAKTEDVLLMESKKNGITDFINSLSADTKATNCGAIVMNCNPFTLGHQYLIENAAENCDKLYVFIVSENKSRFSFEDRFTMATLGTEHIKNAVILPTGPYLISSATFPTYFIKDKHRADDIKCALDIKIFSEYFAPKFSIKQRYVGSEPFCEVTRRYNARLMSELSDYNINLIETKRLSIDNEPVSASLVRKLIDEKNTEIIKKYVPLKTFEFLKNKDFI